MYIIPFSDHVSLLSGGSVVLDAIDSTPLPDFDKLREAVHLMRSVSEAEQARLDYLECAIGFVPKDWPSYEVAARMFLAQTGEMAARKRIHQPDARTKFNQSRSKKFIAMIDAGVAYVCAHEGCGATTSLTIDHIIPLSRGGTNDLSNLQFLCKHHNCSKGAKLPDTQ